MKFEDSLVDKIRFLCREISKEEWSGVLFYVVEGSIKDPENMTVTLKELFPMQKGVAAYTEYSFNEELIDFRMENPETNWMRIGHMHSHNTMQTFFSGTDTSELHDNSEFHNYYLSVIVNNYFDVSARIAFRGRKLSYTIIGKDEDGEEYQLVSGDGQDVMFYYECEVMREQQTLNVPKSFFKRTLHIIKEAAKPRVPAVIPKNTIPDFKRKTMADYLDEPKKNPNELPFRFIDDELIVLNKEDDDEDQSENLIEDFLIDLLTSYPMVEKAADFMGEQFFSLDDVFLFIRDKVVKKNRDHYMQYVIEELPIQYELRFTSTVDEFDNDILIMIHQVESLKEDYNNAQSLASHLLNFLQKFRDAGKINTI